MDLAAAIGAALWQSFTMAWDVLWPLILGFALSGAVQAVVSHKFMARLLGDNSVRGLTVATLFGAASVELLFGVVGITPTTATSQSSLKVRSLITPAY